MIDKLCIYGGSFDPVHKGHEAIVSAALDCLKPDKLIIMPTYNPPHKESNCFDNCGDRLAMLHLVFDEYGDKIEISDYEISKGGISYTSDTLRHFKKTANKIYFICGSDMFLTIDLWHEPQKIFNIAHVAYVLRGGEEGNVVKQCFDKAIYYDEKYKGKCEAIMMPPITASSSQIRQDISRGKKPDTISPKVYQYILQRSLYI